MVKNILLVLMLLICTDASAQSRSRRRTKAKPVVQTVVSQKEMQKVYEAARTPYKYGLVLLPKATTGK